MRTKNPVNIINLLDLIIFKGLHIKASLPNEGLYLYWSPPLAVISDYIFLGF